MSDLAEIRIEIKGDPISLTQKAEDEIAEVIAEVEELVRKRLENHSWEISAVFD